MKSLYNRIKSIHLGKKINLAGMYVIFIIGIVSTIVNDDSSVTKKELKSFYQAKLDSCTIMNVRKVKYPGRGYYDIFRTDCSHEYYPVLLEQGQDHYQLFTTNSILTKESKSYHIVIWNNSKRYETTIRNPTDEGILGLSIGIIVTFAVVVTVIILVLPNSMYDRMMEQLNR